MTSRILGTGSYLPAKILTNADLERMVDTTDEWITERTGIKSRHIAADGELTSDMAAAAAAQALEMAGIRAEDLDLIVMGTVTPDMPMPACAAFVQAKLGAHKACAFDLSAACAGSLYGLAVADGFIATGRAKHALVLGGELLSRVVDWTDRQTCVLFGDAAGALVVGASDSPDRGLLSVHLQTDGRLAEILTIPVGGKVQMNGKEVFKAAVRALAESLSQTLRSNGVRPDQVDHVCAHQANMRIIEAVLKRVEIPMERCGINLHKYGNTSSASLPIALDEANRAGKLRRGDLVAMMAIGAGVSWGSALMRW